MRSMIKITWIKIKLFLREPVGAFFTLVFPLMMLFLFGGIYGNLPTAEFGEKSTIDTLIPALTSMIIGMTGLMSVTITLATYRENGILRRLRTTPVSPLSVLMAHALVVFIMTCLGVFLLVLAGNLVYNIHFEGNAIKFIGGFILSSLSFFGIGFILAGTLPNARTAQIVAMVLLYPMLILSGAAWPRELMPEIIQKISAFLPLTFVVNLLKGLWFNAALSTHLLDLFVLSGMLLIGIIISVKTFSWE